MSQKAGEEPGNKGGPN